MCHWLIRRPLNLLYIILFAEWIEFNPYEVGFQKYGAYIRTEDFDSPFYMGKLVKRFPESQICYLEGNLLAIINWKMQPTSSSMVLESSFLLLVNLSCQTCLFFSRVINVHFSEFILRDKWIVLTTIFNAVLTYIAHRRLSVHSYAV